MGQGLPEPDLILYGKVIDTGGPVPLRLGYGTLSWTFQPGNGGPAVSYATTLTNINNELSYVLHIPCETPVFGQAATPKTVQLTGAGLAFNLATVLWNGTNLLSFAQPAQSNTVFFATDRGRVEQVDLQLSAPEVIDPFNGLPVVWELTYFGRTGVDPNADPDGDGMTNFQEYLAGTNPNDATSTLLITGLTVVDGGLQISWLSAVNRQYTVQRADALGHAFTDLQSGLAATPPTNSWVIPTPAGAGPQFYRLRLNP